MKGVYKLLVFGNFEHSLELEQALAVLEQNGVSRRHIMVVQMETDPKSPLQYIGKSRDRYYKGIEVGMACATASAVVGISIGFVLTWGPILWALICAFVGFTIGFGIYLLANKNNYRHLPKKLPEVTVIVQCPEAQSERVMEIMWKYSVLTVGRAPEPS